MYILLPLSFISNLNLQTITTFTPTFIFMTMALIEEKWAVIANKYRYGINVDEASKDELVEFIQTIIYLHNEQDLINTNL